MKRDNHNTVDVRVGNSLRRWIISVYGTDVIKLGKDSNLWMIVKQNLNLLPDNYTPVLDHEEYITFVLLTDGGNTLAYKSPDEKHPERRQYRVHTLYRCCISERGENIIIRFITKQFKNAFHNYMSGAMNNNPELSITAAITEYLQDCCYPEIDHKIIATLTKDWYRYRLKYPDNFKIPIFF